MQASRLKYLDEADFYCGSRLKRCRVVDHPVVQGDRVELKIRPVATIATAVRITLSASSELTVYPDRTPKRKTPVELWKEAILWALKDNTPAVHIDDVLERIKGHPDFPFSRLPKKKTLSHALLIGRFRRACKLLRRDQEIAFETEDRLPANDRTYDLYIRKTLNLYPGLPVKRIGRDDSANHGYVKKVSYSSVGNHEVAIVQWLNGTVGHVLAPQLQPVENPYWTNRIKSYNPSPSPQQELIPWHYRAELMKPTTGKFTGSPVNAEALADLADFLGICPIGTRLIADKRNRVLSILNEHYPNWKEESSLYVNAREAGNQRSAS